MKLKLPSYKYKDDYFSGIKDAITYGDVYELGNAYREGESFNHMIKRLNDRRKGKNISSKDAPATIYFIINNEDKMVGTIDLRHILKYDYLTTLGHIAYYIFPKYRNRGNASAALSLAINEYKKKDINSIMITCLEENVFSQKVIEKNGGVLESTFYSEKFKANIRKYKIDIK